MREQAKKLEDAGARVYLIDPHEAYRTGHFPGRVGLDRFVPQEFEAQVTGWDAPDYVEISYEFLDSEPIEALERIYGQLGLEGFESALPRFQAYLDRVRGYRKNVFHADPETADVMRTRFGYCFEEVPGSGYPPILDLVDLEGPVHVRGRGGAVVVEPFRVRHGPIDALGYRIGGLAYTPDVSDMPEEAMAAVSGVDCWIVDALRHRPHPTHAHLDRALGWIEHARPKQAVLTNLHVDMDYHSLRQALPERVVPAHDGMTIQLDASNCDIINIMRMETQNP